MKKTSLARRGMALALTVLLMTALAGCSGGGEGREGDDSTANVIFLYPINYYGIEGKAFTSRWQGMTAALEDLGWEITGDEGQKDSQQFRATRLDSCTMPEDTQIIFINNQTWDTNLALTDKLLEYTPLAVITTCNGVEFCSERIAASSPDTRNMTYAGFSENYKAAFEEGTVDYIEAKYSASIAPIVAALWKAVTTGERLEDSSGMPLHLTQGFWPITSYEEYVEMEKYDVIDGPTPTIMKLDMDAHLGSYEDLAAFVSDSTSTFEGVKALVDGRGEASDTPAGTDRFKLGVLVPSAINDAVQYYLDYIEGYLASAYNYEVQRFSVSNSVNQETAARQAVQAGCAGIISLQDDTDRQAACELADRNGVWFAVAGACVYGTSEWEQMAACAHYVGSVGTSLQDEFDAGYRMVKRCADIIIERGER